jgi:hypothetical protein
MKSLLLIAVLALTGCVTAPNADPKAAQLQYADACGAYGVAFATALQLRTAGKLSQSQISQITLVDSQVTPICTGAMPTNPAEAAAKVTQAIASLATIEAMKEGAK